uniref:Uncharacterized protein n=1 Tax=Lepeophtheirus salmonis TaxID=72036 RepID=A0A0K2UT80_LEPSM
MTDTAGFPLICAQKVLSRELASGLYGRIKKEFKRTHKANSKESCNEGDRFLSLFVAKVVSPPSLGSFHLLL